VRIAMLHWAFPPIIGGVESHLAMLCPELNRYGCQVSLLTGATREGDMEYTWRGLKIYRHRLMDLNSLDEKELVNKKNDIRRLIVKFIQHVHPDIIHAHNMHYFSPVHLEALLEAKRCWGIPLILTAHNVWSDSLWEEMCRYASEWDAVIAVSHYIKQELVKAGFPEDRITVVYHGIDLERFRPPGEEDLQKVRETYPEIAGKRVIFHPARMSYDKGCHISIKAFQLIKEQFPDTMLVLAGTEKTVDWGSKQPEHVSRIRNLITETGLEKDIFIRFFPWDEIPLMYQAAEICVYPSCFEEPFGLAMLESLATGRPIVVSRAGGMPEVIQDGVNGFVVPMHDHESLAQKCCYLLANPDRARKMGATGRQMVEKDFTRETMTARTLQVYGKVLASYLRRQVQIV